MVFVEDEEMKKKKYRNRNRIKLLNKLKTFTLGDNNDDDDDDNNVDFNDNNIIHVTLVYMPLVLVALSCWFGFLFFLSFYPIFLHLFRLPFSSQYFVSPS